MFQFKKFYILLFFSVILGTVFSQDIISADGHNMGPKSIFIEVCAGDDVDIEMYNQQGYSTIEFCDCLADNLLPTLTKSQMNYYFTQNNHKDIFVDTALSRITTVCMLDVMENWKQPAPPPQEIITTTKSSVPSEELIDNIVELVDYESKFNEILENRLKSLKTERELSESQLKELKQNILFDELQMVFIKDSYAHYSNEDLSVIYDYLSGMSPEELSNSAVKYEQITIDLFHSNIEFLIEEEFK